MPAPEARVLEPGEAGAAAGLRLSERLSPAAGVRITGIDLAGSLGPARTARIVEALLAHHVVVFPEQAISRERQFAFAACFGEVEAHRGYRGEAKRYATAHVMTNLDADGNPAIRVSRAANYHWHTDKPYHPAPPMLTILHAVEVPPFGADTQFANMAMAYASLPQTTKRWISGLRVAFSPAFEALGAPGAMHPLVRTHPDTGLKSLYLGNHSTHIVGMPEAEGRALLGELLAHATRPEFVYSHRWRRGDVVMWDNRCLLHRVVADEGLANHRRIMYRSVVKGSVPV